MTVDAENRAGRPGLAHVMRDSKGRTLAITGDAGAERPGTTLRPAWLKVRGLELEREVKAWVDRDAQGSINLHEVRDGTLDYWLRHVQPGEPVLVFDDDTSKVVAKASMTAEGDLKLDRDPPPETVMVVLTRVREVASCALDLITRPMTNSEIGMALSRHRTLVAREVKKALGHACEAAEEQDIDRADFVRALMLMGQEKR